MTEQEQECKDWFQWERLVAHNAANSLPPPRASLAPRRPSDELMSLWRRKKSEHEDRADAVRTAARARGIKDLVAIEQLAGIIPVGIEAAEWVDSCIRLKPSLLPQPKADLVDFETLNPQEQKVALDRGAQRQAERMRSASPEAVQELNRRAGITDYIPPAPIRTAQDPDVVRAKLPLESPAQVRYRNYCEIYGDFRHGVHKSLAGKP